MTEQRINDLLNPMQQHTTIVAELRYNRRFPNIFTLNKTQQFPITLNEVKIVAVKLASHGIPYAFTTWIIYGRQMCTAFSSIKNCIAMTRINGFKTRLCLSSFILSQNVTCLECSQCIECAAHETQAVEFCSFVNSSCTTSADTHPRNHCSDFWASFGRFFDSSQFGVSGICKCKWKGEWGLGKQKEFL